MQRRNLLVASAAVALSGFAPSAFAAEAAACTWPPPSWVRNGFPSRRWVNAVSVDTGERFKNVYVEDGAYIAPAVQQFSWVCRDFRANAWKLLDPRLMDLLFVLHWKYCKDEIKILSGYRTAQTNALPENPQQFEGHDANEKHEHARALDIHVQGVDNDDVARSFNTIVYGGVGINPHRDFVHVDTGAARRWITPSPKHVWSGSGFIVNRQGYVVTNAHVAKNCPSLVITHEGREFPASDVVAMDESVDLAILRIDATWATAPVLSAGDVQMGDSILALGYPLQGILGGPILTTGIVNALGGLRGDVSQIQISAPVQPGNSGGPVLDDTGRVVGVVVGKLDALKVAEATGDIPQNINFAISLGTLRRFLKLQDVQFAEMTEGTTLKPRDIAALAMKYTVAIDCWR